jgi:hypothetical protein
MDTKKLLYTVFEAEELTGRKAATWRRDILTRRIPYVKIGRQVRIPCEVIQDLIKRGYRFPVGEELMTHARSVKDSQKAKRASH